MAKAVIDFDQVRKIALEWPEVEEGTTYGTPALKVRGKLLACIPTNRAAEPDSLAVSVSFERRDELLATDPDVYYLKDHYRDYPVVLVRLSRIHVDALRDLLWMGWGFAKEMGRRRKRDSKKSGAPGER